MQQHQRSQRTGQHVGANNNGNAHVGANSNGSAQSSSPAVAATGGGTGPSTAGSSSYSGQFYAYLYNSVASLSNAVGGEAKLLDDVPCYVNGRVYQGPKTTAWASESVQACAYFTYRRGIPRLPHGAGDHDAGWGCMIRTGQMMLCQALRRLFRCEVLITNDPMEYALFRQWVSPTTSRQSSALLSPPASPRGGTQSAPNLMTASTDSAMVSPASSVSPSQPSPQQPSAATGASGCGAIFCWVQEFFMDTADAPFGLHRLALEGAKLNVPVGSWFSPTVLARSLTALVPQCPEVHERMAVFAALDQTVPQDAILNTLMVDEKASLLLVPLMLGMTTIGKTYEAVLLRMLEMPSCVGLVGGKPQKSLYFVGHQGDQVFYLDPHVVQPAFTSRATMGRVGGPRGTTSVTTLDPCMLACFFFEREEGFLEWCDEMSIVNRLGEFPVVTLTTANTTEAGPSSTTMFRRSSPRQSIDACEFDTEDDDVANLAAGVGGAAPPVDVDDLL